MADLDREYSLYEIAIITRAGPARMLGLAQKGHLGAGADADITIYTPGADRKAMFELPCYVIKNGEVIVEQGEIRQSVLRSDAACDPAVMTWTPCRESEWFEENYSIRFANYGAG